MSAGILGDRSSIAREFAKLVWPNRETPAQATDSYEEHDRLLICIGYLAGKSVLDLTSEEEGLTWQYNFIDIAATCDAIFRRNPRARICIIGSHSGFEGSFDMAYAGAKAAMHLYIETKRLEHPDQMLVGLAPHIIWNSGMTQRRGDLAELEARGKSNRLGRWLDAAEVAREAYHLLFEASPSLSGQVIRMRP